jgi:hypothetical protein
MGTLGAIPSDYILAEEIDRVPEMMPSTSEFESDD